jgi:hypothetical protein
VKDTLQSPAFPGDHSSDIDKCIDSPPVSWLKWWKANSFAYPLIAQAVRDYLPVPSAEVGIGRVFSGGTDVLGLWRQSWLMLLNEKKWSLVQYVVYCVYNYIHQLSLLVAMLLSLHYAAFPFSVVCSTVMDDVDDAGCLKCLIK